MTSAAMHDYAHTDTMWSVGAETSTRTDSGTHCLTMGQELMEWSDLDTLIYSWHISGALFQGKQGFLSTVSPMFRDIEQLVMEHFFTQPQQGTGRQFTDANFSKDPLLMKLDELASLPLGWEYGKGRATLPDVSQVAREIYRRLAPLRLQVDAFPCADGALHLVFYAGLRSVELRIEADQTIDLSMEEKRGYYFEEIVTQEGVPKHEITNQVLHLLYTQELSQWESLDSFTPGITINERVNLAVHDLVTQATEPEYRWWKQSAFGCPTRRYANILTTTTQTLWENPSSTGKSPLVKFSQNPSSFLL